MTALDPALQAHLDDGTTTLSWCWRIARTDGFVLGFTDHDRDLIFDGTTFASETGLIPSEVRASSDLAVDAQDAEGILTAETITETDIADGLWDNATVEVWRVNWAAPAQRSLRRKGSIGQIRRGKVSFIAEVRSLTHALGQTVGRIYQSSCDAEVGDARCGVDLEAAAFKGTGAVTALDDARSFTASGLGAFAGGWFTFGRITWTSGANAGRTSEVAAHRHEGATVTLILHDLPVRAVAASDGFVVRAGCSKLMSVCAGKFANVPNFRGFPAIPGQDSVMRYATLDGKNAGDVL